MTKDKIIKIAESMGFKLDYDKSDGKGKSNIQSDLKYIRFVSIDDSLDEQDLRWIWYMDKSDDDNLTEGKYIKSRLDKKKQIQEFLKY